MSQAQALDCGDASRRSHFRQERWLTPPQSRASLLIALLLIATPLFAATATSAITGRVMSGGAPAAGVTITVTSPALQGERTTITTRNGRYWLTALPPGRYDVTFSRAKLQTLTRRVLVELSRVSRADAVLEPSEDEESITSTALPLSVADTTVITSHVSDEMFDRLPIRRDPFNAAAIAPGPWTGIFAFINDASALGSALGQESLEQVTVLRGAPPADYEGGLTVINAKTRSGGEDYFFSLRDTITNAAWVSTNFPNFETYDNGVEHLVEANAGGRIVKDKLWFFASGWNGGEILFGDLTGYETKLTWQPAAQHNLMAFFSEAETGTVIFRPDTTIAALRYTGTAGPRLTTEVVVGRATSGNAPAVQPLPISRFRSDSFFAKTTYVAGDHVLSAGGQTMSTGFGYNPGPAGPNQTWAFFVNDRWRVQRFTFNLGARHEHDRLSPRLSGTFDVRGNGRQAIGASFSEYSNSFIGTREATLGFATAVGTTGSIRVDGFRRDHGAHGDTWGVMGEFRYTLFDRFHTGASYTWFDFEPNVLLFDAQHTAHAWAGVDIPVGEHEFGVTAMQHYRSAFGPGLSDSYPSDLALRYSLPISRVRLTVAADALNVFDQRGELFSFGRSFRGWLRLRL
jgi:hypothetical protein